MKAKRPKKRSPLELKFERIWADIHGPALVKELKFIEDRKFRADFAHMGSRTLIEIEGGVFVRGRHMRPGGFINDCEKYYLATMNGWSVIRLTPNMITANILSEIAAFTGDVPFSGQ